MAVKSADRTLAVFELLMLHPDGLILKDIAAKLGFAGSSTYELVRTLAERGYLQEDENRRYRLGARLIQLGEAASQSMDIVRIATPVLRQLMETVQETVFMAILDENEIVYTAIVNSYRSVSTNARMGTHKPLYCTGLGKAFLAFLPEEESRQLMAGREMVRHTRNTITDPAELEKSLETYRRQGYATDNEEIEEGLWCVARPVYDHRGHMEAAVSISGPVHRMRSREKFLAEELGKATARISQALGYTR